MPPESPAARPLRLPHAAPQLPPSRGPLTEALFAALIGGGSAPQLPGPVSVDVLGDEDLQLALYCAYELQYRGFEGVDERWEWDLSLLSLRSAIEAVMEEQLRAALPPFPQGAPVGRVVDELWSMANAGGPSLSGWLVEHGTHRHAAELAVHRSAYQLKEADPHTWAVPRLAGEAKAALVAIQFDEYGGGEAQAMHASLFADTMTSLGLDSTYGAYLDRIPGVALATTNLISLFGLHRRLRGALVGHLALFEMTSVGPMGRYARWMRRLGVPASGRRFYEVHVEADELHQHVAADGLVGGLLRSEPGLGADVVFGARALSLAEARFAAMAREAWERGGSSLRPGLPDEPLSARSAA